MGINLGSGFGNLTGNSNSTSQTGGILNLNKNDILDLTIEDLKDILTKSLDGTDEIISTRSKIIKENNIDLNSMSLNELLEFIKKNPTVLKRPIMVDDKKIQVGYNPEEIRVFIPRARRIAQSMCSHENCPTFDTCPHLKDMEENNK